VLSRVDGGRVLTRQKMLEHKGEAATDRDVAPSHEQATVSSSGGPVPDLQGRSIESSALDLGHLGIGEGPMLTRGAADYLLAMTAYSD